MYAGVDFCIESDYVACTYAYGCGRDSLGPRLEPQMLLVSSDSSTYPRIVVDPVENLPVPDETVLSVKHPAASVS